MTLEQLDSLKAMGIKSIVLTPESAHELKQDNSGKIDWFNYAATKMFGGVLARYADITINT